MKTVTLISPFDAHYHGRVGAILFNIIFFTTHVFSGALFMPNINPFITSLVILLGYIRHVQKAIGKTKFLPVFTFYLSDTLSLKDLERAWRFHLIVGVKYYPKGGTTKSEGGLVGFSAVHDQLRLMEVLGIPLLVHGEIPIFNGEVVDDFDREFKFLKEEMESLRAKYPKLKIVLEHITTKEAAEFVKTHDNTWATITPQHVLLDRRAEKNLVKATKEGYVYSTDQSGIFPYHICRPNLKRTEHVLAIRDALIWQAETGAKKFGLGTDSAHHKEENKFCECGACGFFSAPIALEMYAMAFEEMGILDHLPAFACDIMPEFYGIKELLPYKKVVLEKKAKKVPETFYGNARTPFSGQIIPWSATVVES